MIPPYDLDTLVRHARQWLREHDLPTTSMNVYDLVARLRRQELQHARQHTKQPTESPHVAAEAKPG